MTRLLSRSLLAVLSAAFTFLANVKPLQATSIAMEPPSGAQSTTQIVMVTGSGTHFVQGTTNLSLGPGISVSSVVVNGPTELEAGIAIAPTAPTGSHTVSVTTGSEIVSTSYAVQIPPRALIALSNNAAAPGTTDLAVVLQGASTSWVNGTTTAVFGPGVSVGGAASGTPGPVTVTSPTTATAKLSIDATAALGSRTVTIQTGPETENALNAFTVQTCPGFAASTDGGSNVPVNGVIQIPYSAPLDRSSLTGQTFSLVPIAAGASQPVNVSLDVTGTVLTIAPTSVLPLNTVINLRSSGSGIRDSCGLPVVVVLPGVNNTFQLPGLQVVATNPPAAFAAFPTSATLAFLFNQPVQLGSLASGISITSAAGPLAGTFSLSSPTRVVFSPTQAVAPNTTYTVTYTQAITNTAAAPLTNPASFTFTTGSGTVSDASEAISPALGATNVPTNTQFALWSPSPFDPTIINATSVVITDSVTGTTVPAVVSLSSDLLTLSAKPSKPLQPYRSYSVSSPRLGTSFTTGSGPSSAPTTVTQIFPANGATNVPVGGDIDVQFSNQIDPGSLSLGSISVVLPSGLPVQGGTLTPSADGLSLFWTPPFGDLSPNTTYTVKIAGVSDVDGAPVTPFAATFTTGSSGGYYGTLSITPAAGAVNVSRTLPIVLNSTAPIDPIALSSLSITADQSPVPGSWSVSGSTATFTPSPFFPSGSQVTIQGFFNEGYLHGGLFVSQSFTVAYAAGAPSFSVIGITPANNLTGVSPLSPVLIRLSQPVGAIPQNSIQMFNGDRFVNPNAALSSDHKTITISPVGLSNNTTVTISVNASLVDMYGTPVAPFTSHFTTLAAAPSAFYSTVSSPSNYSQGVPATAPILIVLNRAGIDQTSVQNSLLLTASGDIVEATVTFPNPQLIEIIPATPFPAGSTINCSFAGQDIYGNPLTFSPLTFYVAGTGSAAAQVVANSIGWLQPGSSVPVIELAYDQPLDPSSIGSNDFVLQQYPGTAAPVPVTITLTGASHNILVVAPQGSLYSFAQYFLSPGTETIQGANGVAARGFSNYYNIPGPPVSTPARLIGTIPDNNWNGVGTNAQLTLAFDKPLDSLSLSAGALTLSAGSQNVPIDWSIDSDQIAGLTTVTINPVQFLSPTTLYTLRFSGFVDSNGNAVAAGSLTFSTGPGPNATPPQVVAVSPTGQALPLNASIIVQFDQPIASYALSQSLPQSGNWTLSTDHKTATFTPTSLWAPGSVVQIEPGIVDETGVGVAYYFVPPSFETGYSSNISAPSITGTNPKSGATGMPLNVQIEAAFSSTLSPLSLAGITLAASGGPVAITSSLGSDATTLFVQPSALLSPNTTYTLTISGVTDTEGNTIATPYSFSFTTGTSTLGAGSILAENPQGQTNSLGPLSPVIIQYSQPVNPLSLSSSNFTVTQAPIPIGGTISLSPDDTSILFTPDKPWIPGATYTVSPGTQSPLLDIAGNPLPGPQWTFVTPDVLVSGSEAVASVSPANGSTVPANSELQVMFTDAVDPATINRSSISITSTTGTVPTGSLSTSGALVTYTLAPGSIWSPGSQYTIQVSGVTNTAGVAAPTFTSAFTASAAVANPNFTVTSITPTYGSTLTSNTTPIIVTFSEPPNPLTVSSGSSVLVGGINHGYISGTWSLHGNAATFTPASPYPPNTGLQVRLGGVTDLAGDPVNMPYSYFVTSAPGTDTTPFRLVSITPANGAAGLGTSVIVAMQFSQPIDASTLNGIALYSGDTVLQPSTTYSPDGRTVVLTPQNGRYDTPGTTLTVVGTSNLKDLSGNPLQPFESKFSLSAPPLLGGPAVQSVRPASGATGVPINIPITFFVSGSPVDASTTENAIHVFQDGLPVSGTTRLVGTNVVQFIGSRGWKKGAIISATIDSTLADVNGFTLISQFASSFTTSPLPTSIPQLLRTNMGANYTIPTNGRIELLFDQPLDPSSVTPSAFDLYVPHDTGVAISTALGGPNNNLVLITPLSGFAANTYYSLGSGTTSLRSAAGGLFPFSTGYGFSTSPQAAGGIYVSQVNPPDAYPVPTNASVQISFSGFPDPVTINPQTVTLTASGHQQPCSFALPAYSGGQLVITPFTPLPANVTVTVQVNGVTDMAGNATPAFTSQFVTGSGPALNSPLLLLSTPGDGGPLPTNSKILSFQFNEPIDPLTVNSSTFKVSELSNNVPGVISQSADGTTVTFTASQPLTPGGEVSVSLGTVTDLAGNQSYCCNNMSFEVGSGPSTTPLTLSASNPQPNWKNVPVNVNLQLLFNTPLDLSTLPGIKLFEGSAPVPVAPTLNSFSSEINVQTAALLEANQSYTLTLSGLRDVAGNTLASPITIPFTTGPAANLTSVTGTLIAPATPSSASPNTLIKVQFSAPVNPISINMSLTNSSGQSVPTNFSLSSDGMTATWTPLSAFGPGSYNFGVSAQDDAGNYMQNLYTSITVP